METIFLTIELSLNGNLAQANKKQLQAALESVGSYFAVLTNSPDGIKIVGQLQKIDKNSSVMIFQKAFSQVDVENIFDIVSVSFLQNVEQNTLKNYLKTQLSFQNENDSEICSVFKSAANERLQKLIKAFDENAQAKDELCDLEPVVKIELEKIKRLFSDSKSSKNQRLQNLISLKKLAEKIGQNDKNKSLFEPLLELVSEFSDLEDYKSLIFSAEQNFVRQELQEIFHVANFLISHANAKSQKEMLEKSAKKCKVFILLRGKVKRSFG